MPKSNDHILVVGGASGLGLSIAQTAHALGCRVTIAGRGKARVAEIAKSIGAGAAGVAIDLEDSGSIRAALATGDAIDHLVLTAIPGGNINTKDFNVVEAMKMARVKLVGYAEVVNAALPRLKPTSSIVLFGGVAKSKPYPGSTMVTTVNGGIVGLTRTLAVELAPIRVNGISPGLVQDSPRWVKRVSEGAGPLVAAFTARAASRRNPTVADIVHGVFFLMDNRAVDGIDLELDGGIQLT